MLQIIERFIAVVTGRRFFYLLVPWDTSIGIGSELIRLALVKAVLRGEQVTLLRARIPFGRFLFRVRYPKEIYRVLRSSAIRREYQWLRVLFEYCYGLKFASASLILSVINLRKVLTPKDLIGHGGLYFPEVTGSRSWLSCATALSRARALRKLPDVGLDEASETKCRLALRALGLEGRWYVCLHVRTSAFYKDKASYRNASLQNYYSAIDLVISQGGVVVRMGDPVPGFIDGPRPGLIDYPSTCYKSELMDLYLIKNCRVYIGTQSGIIDTAMLFSKPILSVNSLHFAMAGAGSHNLTIYKKILHKRKNCYLSFSQSMVLYHKITRNTYEEFSREFEWVENSSEEILEALKEILEGLHLARLPSSSLQRSAQRILKRKAKDYAYSPDLVHTQAIYSRVIVGQKYLEKWMNGGFE